MDQVFQNIHALERLLMGSNKFLFFYPGRPYGKSFILNAAQGKPANPRRFCDDTVIIVQVEVPELNFKAPHFSDH